MPGAGGQWQLGQHSDLPVLLFAGRCPADPPLLAHVPAGSGSAGPQGRASCLPVSGDLQLLTALQVSSRVDWKPAVLCPMGGGGTPALHGKLPVSSCLPPSRLWPVDPVMFTLGSLHHQQHQLSLL